MCFEVDWDERKLSLKALICGSSENETVAPKNQQGDGVLFDLIFWLQGLSFGGGRARESHVPWTSASKKESCPSSVPTKTATTPPTLQNGSRSGART